MTKVTVICTTFNEAESIEALLSGLASQSLQPAEVIICDARSTDGTPVIIKQFARKHSKLKIRLIEKKSNRSQGRNLAIKSAKNNLIAITDAGCIPDKNWSKELVKKHEATEAPVVAGYYRGGAKTPFEQAVVPYVLVMPNRIPKGTFLPATRSMLIEKKVWKQLGGFDESLSLNEDYPFALKIQSAGYKIAFAKKAVVAWLPRKNISEFATMIFQFAKGDVIAGVFRPKVMLIFARYLLLIAIIVVLIISLNIKLLLGILMIGTGVYSLWAIRKNIQHVSAGWMWLPILQVVSDFAVMLGSLSGIKKFLDKKY